MKKNNKYKIVTFRIDATMLKKINEKVKTINGEDFDLNLSQYIRSLIIKDLKKEEN